MLPGFATLNGQIYAVRQDRVCADREGDGDDHRGLLRAPLKDISGFKIPPPAQDRRLSSIALLLELEGNRKMT